MTAKETDIYTKKLLVFGCGNTLFGNDGFGPSVIEYIQERFSIPKDVLVMDAGTGIRDFIFDLLLMNNKPHRVILIDAVTVDGKSQGELFEIDLQNMPQKKMADFSLHQSPSSNLLSQLTEQGIDVKVLAMHTASIPNKINPGLCDKAKAAIPKASDWVMNEIKNYRSLQQDPPNKNKRIS